MSEPVSEAKFPASWETTANFSALAHPDAVEPIMFDYRASPGQALEIGAPSATCRGAAIGSRAFFKTLEAQVSRIVAIGGRPGDLRCFHGVERAIWLLNHIGCGPTRARWTEQHGFMNKPGINLKSNTLSTEHASYSSLH
ncbi:MAG: hypothetical protein JOY83_26420 [Alphaproteobacteria bacterium]|nr:hypothetical protein [Alphaproteobacteria bacterium]